MTQKKQTSDLGKRRTCDICGKRRIISYINRFLEEKLCAACERLMGFF